MSLNGLLKTIFCTQLACHLPLFLSYRLWEWQHAGLLSCPLCHGLLHHARLFSQQHPGRNRILLDAFTAAGNVSGSHTWQAGRAVLSTEHVLRQTHTSWPPSLLHCPQPSLHRHCLQAYKLHLQKCHRGRVLVHERRKNCLAAFHLSHRRTAFSLTCTQTLVVHDKPTLQSCLVFLLKFLMQNTAYVRNALIQYGKSYVLSLSLVVNGVQNTGFFLDMSISTHCLWYNTVAALVYLKASCF